MTDARAQLLMDRVEIAQLLQSWGMWRDGGDWDRLRSAYTADATMVVSWFDGLADDFIDRCILLRERSLRAETQSLSHHLVGGAAIDVRGDRAVADTRVTIMMRFDVHGIECDVTAIGRFFDLLTRVDGNWRIHRRVAVFEKDTLRAVNPEKNITVDEAQLARFPTGYRYTAYAMAARGIEVSDAMPGSTAASQAELRASGTAWLA
jgi:hypothetical protein